MANVISHPPALPTQLVRDAMKLRGEVREFSKAYPWIHDQTVGEFREMYSKAVQKLEYMESDPDWKDRPFLIAYRVDNAKMKHFIDLLDGVIPFRLANNVTVRDVRDVGDLK